MIRQGKSAPFESTVESRPDGNAGFAHPVGRYSPPLHSTSRGSMISLQRAQGIPCPWPAQTRCRVRWVFPRRDR